MVKHKAEKTQYEDVYEVEAVRSIRLHKGRVQYFLKWKGWNENYNSWEPRSHLVNCREALMAFEKSQKLPLPDTKEEEAEASNKLKLEVEVEKVIKVLRYTHDPVDEETDVHIIFKVLRCDGEEMELDNIYLRKFYPDMLFDFYESRARHRGKKQQES